MHADKQILMILYIKTLLMNLNSYCCFMNKKKKNYKDYRYGPYRMGQNEPIIGEPILHIPYEANVHFLTPRRQ